MPVRFCLHFFLLCAIVFLAGCAKRDRDITETWTAEELYAEARANLNEGAWDNAEKLYKKLEARFPFGYRGQQALVDLAYVYYRNENYDAAIETCNRFIKLFPRHAYVDYLYYLKGIINFYRSSGFLDRVAKIDLSQRDSLSSQESLQSFSELIARFPNSAYTPDAERRAAYLNHLLAKNEVNVAHYYMRRNAFLAALNRAIYVAEHYRGTSAVADALVVMARCYRILGMESLADSTLRILVENFPNHPDIEHIRTMQVRQ